MSFPIRGTTAFVTGANRGIGAALVEALLEAGAERVYAAARQIEQATALRDRFGARVVPIALDVTQPDQVEAAASAAPDVQLLINNAGVAAHMGGAFTDPAWIARGREEMEVNVFGALDVMQRFAPVLAANGGGAVVNVSSIAAFVGFPLVASYSASKAAVHSLTQSARVMLSPQGTRVIGVYPGPIDTRMAESLPFDKTAPLDAARAIVAGIAAGDEDIFPDAASQGMAQAFFADPKGFERHLAAGAAA